MTAPGVAGVAGDDAGAPVPLAGATLRANAGYELVLFDRLPAEQRAMLDGLRRDPTMFGILRPRGERPELAVKSACRDTALLFYALQTPGPLPAYVTARHGADAARGVAELVLDGVLEVEVDGAFVSGPAAYRRCFGRPAPGEPDAAPEGRIARLSRAALQYVAALAPDDCARLSARLYLYNRVPASPAWARRLAPRGAVAEHWGLAARTVAGRLSREWRPVRRPDPPDDGWLEWRSRRSAPSVDDGAPSWKLYVSPTPDRAADALAATIAALPDGDAHHFKIGGDLHGVLRPDKLVAYFRTFDGMQATAARIRAALDGCPAQGVPFTAPLGDDGLLSWGMDPPAAAQSHAWAERESWRLWVTNRLATAILAASVAPTVAGAPTPWAYAMTRIRLDRVDPVTWTPAPDIWDAPAAASVVPSPEVRP